MKMLVGMKGIEPPYTCSQSKPTAIVSHSDVTERKAEQESNPHKIQWWTKNKNTQKTSRTQRSLPNRRPPILERSPAPNGDFKMLCEDVGAVNRDWTCPLSLIKRLLYQLSYYCIESRTIFLYNSLNWRMCVVHNCTLAGTAGLEPATNRLTADCSTYWAIFPYKPP